MATRLNLIRNIFKAGNVTAGQFVSLTSK